jgi:hypothetical protein
MLDDLKAWEAAASPTAPKLLVVSTGAVEANRARGFAHRCSSIRRRRSHRRSARTARRWRSWSTKKVG